MKQQIKFKDLTEDQTIQIIDLDDAPNISNPLTKKEFIKEYLQEIVDDNDGEVSVDEAFEMILDSVNCDWDRNKVYTTVIEGVTKVVLS